MSSKRYTEEFKIEAVKQVTERGYSASEDATRLGVNSNSIYNWLKKYGQWPRMPPRSMTNKQNSGAFMPS